MIGESVEQFMSTDETERMVQFMFAQACKSLALVMMTADKHHLTSPKLHLIRHMAQTVTSVTPSALLEAASVIESGGMTDGR